MDTQLLAEKFRRIGARLKFADHTPRHPRMRGAIALDVGKDRRGEYFELFGPPEAEVEALDVRPRDRHLLLLVREEKDKLKLLCGHDERHWFVAGIPDAAPVGTVLQAKEALKPREVRLAEVRQRLRSGERHTRRNPAFVRQGEWFFLPEPGLVVDARETLRNEPLRRGNGGKPHWVDECVRTGGETVYVNGRYPNGLLDAQYRALLSRRPAAARWSWQTMQRNPQVYVRGRVRHADHATITLPMWHRVAMNTEGASKAMRNVAFLD